MHGVYVKANNGLTRLILAHDEGDAKLIASLLTDLYDAEQAEESVDYVYTWNWVEDLMFGVMDINPAGIIDGTYADREHGFITVINAQPILTS